DSVSNVIHAIAEAIHGVAEARPDVAVPHLLCPTDYRRRSGCTTSAAFTASTASTDRSADARSHRRLLRYAAGHHRQIIRREMRNAHPNMLGPENGFDHFLHARVALRRILGHRLLDYRRERLGNTAHVRLAREMLHQNFAWRSTQERHRAGEHLVDHRAQRV